MACLNWDLGSVVRSCYAIKGSSLKTNPSVAMAANPHSTMSSINNDTLVSPNGNCNQVFGDDKGSFSFPTILESQYGVSNDNSILQATNTSIGTTSSIHISHMAHIDQDGQNQKIEYANFSPSFNSPFVPQKHSMHAHAKAPPSSSVMHLSNQPTFLGKSASHYFQGSYYSPSIMSSQSRPKRMGRRNKKKKICRQVKREDKGNDEWTWRKYGQKAIKGSIHPRSYYRCISSKGCPARKQVQRTPTEPNMFIITYTGEHAHAMLPNPNAGNSRSRYPRLDHKHKENSNRNLIKKVQVDDVDSMNDHKLDAMIAHDHDDFFVELEELDMYQGSSGGCNTSGDFSFGNFFSAPTWAPGNSSTGDGCDGRVSE